MNIKTILEKILGDVHVVDKKDSHDYSQKLDFELYTKASYGEKIGHRSNKLPKSIDLGGSISITLFDDAKNCSCNVRCSNNTRIGKISNLLGGGYEFKFNGKILHNGDTLYKCGIKDGAIIMLNIGVIGGGGEEFYIDDDLLDPSYDYDFRGIDDRNQKFYRGGLEYKRPIGWKRYALKVNERYENDKWLGDSGKSNGDTEWAVSYHGTKHQNMKSIYDNGYRVGYNNAYGVGVYCTPNIETAAEYSEEFTGDDGKKYKIVLQNRVKPSAIKKASDNGGPDDYWYIENGKNIRPYSICVKECK